MPFLARPSEQYKDSYLQAAQEFQAEGRWEQLDTGKLAADFGGFVRELLSWSDESIPRPGLVHESVYWLVDGQEFVGRVTIRHRLTDYLLKLGGHIGYEIRPSERMRGYGKLILKLALEKASSIGLKRVLVTCDEDNVGSRRIIESNGGVLENAVEVEGERARKLRYWINC